MLPRSLKIIGAFLPCAAMLGLSMGCSSSSRAPTRYSESRRDTKVVTARYDSRDVNQQAIYQESNQTGQTKHSSTASARVNRPLRNPDPNAGNGLMGAAEQQGRVTMVATNAPPMTPMEFPSHQPRDGEFWVAGIWRGELGKYIWQPGHVEQDRRGQLYVAAYWISSPRGWEYAPEYWR